MFFAEYLDQTIRKLKDNTANMMTIVNLSLGGFSIIAILSNQLNLALLLIFIAAFTDRLDGIIARKFKIESDLGKQLDSLSDIISFGIAPGILIYQGVLFEFGTSAGFITIFYFACGAVRLARYNVSSTPGYFVGLPITVAGTILTFSFLFAQSLPAQTFIYLTVILALLMVSPFKLKKI